MTSGSQQTLQKHMRAAWRRAADELLIDAIFGTTARIVRDEDCRSGARPRLAPIGAPLEIVAARSSAGLL